MWLSANPHIVGAPDANILLEAIEVLRKGTIAGAAMFLVKVFVHRGEPADEEADIQTDKAISGNLFPRNGTTGQIEQLSLTGKEVR